MINNKLIIDLFAGGGGVSVGLKQALGVDPDVAVNHDATAIAMHATNFPNTKHFKEDIWGVDPLKATEGKSVLLLHASPDCTHFSRAKGKTPLKKNIRGLAWVVLRWAAKTRPNIITLENVPEFVTWGPIRRGKPIKKFSGTTFKKFIQQLSNLGYKVECKNLVAADYGAPTTRKRFFLIARSDGLPIVWPKATHAPRNKAKQLGLLPWVGANEIIDWSIQSKSIFERKKPLSDATMRRIARGLEKFVINNNQPFIVPIGYGEKKGQSPRIHDIEEPLPTIVSGGTKHFLVDAFLCDYHFKNEPKSVEEPFPTITNVRGHSLCSVFLMKYFKGVVGQDIKEPIPTITSIDHSALVSAFLIRYYKGQNHALNIDNPLGTITAMPRFGLVTVDTKEYQIVDIRLRMLEPKELYKAQGFPDTYIYDYYIYNNNKVYISKTEQVKKCGNSVPPPFARALAQANIIDIRKEI